MNRAQSAIRRVTGFLAGQAAVQATNLVTGLAVLWLLPPKEYALYIVCASLISIGNVGTDIGLSQALVTLGSKAKRDTGYLGRLLAECSRIRRFTFIAAAPLLTALGVALIGPYASYGVTLVFLSVVLTTVFAQRRLPYFNGVMNVRQDARGLFVVQIGPAILRLVLILLFCRQVPVAPVALVANLLAMALQDSRGMARINDLVVAADSTDDAIRQQLKRFVTPLIPGLVYYIFQGQLAVLVLGFLGQPASIAEVGALGRLGQLLTLLSMLNPFLIQPRLGAIENRERFRSETALFGAAALVLCVLLIASAFLLPSAWLLILGPHYRDLAYLLPLAVGGPLVGFIGAFFYTAVISTGYTRFQWLQIPLGLGSQALFIVIHGVSNSADALILSWLPATLYAVLQLVILSLVIRFWNQLPGRG